jgi:hypothetical protein
MPSAKFYFSSIEVKLKTGPDICDITDEINHSNSRGDAFRSGELIT